MKALPVWFFVESFNVYDSFIQEQYGISNVRMYKRTKSTFLELIVGDEKYYYKVFSNYYCKIYKIQKG